MRARGGLGTPAGSRGEASHAHRALVLAMLDLADTPAGALGSLGQAAPQALDQVLEPLHGVLVRAQLLMGPRGDCGR